MYKFKKYGKALFVIDVQNFFKNEKTGAIAGKISDYVQKNKNGYEFIVFTVFKNDEKSSLWNILKWQGCNENKDIEIMEPLSAIADKSDIIQRNTYSLLKSPKIQEKLKSNNINEVDICGFDTDCCVLATAYDLFDSGYKVDVLENLCFSTSEEKLHDPAIKILARNCGAVNIK